jgi:WD40 repeat protein
MRHADGVKSAEFSPDGQFIVTACADGTVHLWDAETLQPSEGVSILQHGKRATHACFAPDGHRILTTCTDGSVRIWDLAGSSLPPPAARVSFSADGSRYLESSNGTATVRDSISGARISELLDSASLTNRVQLNQNGQFAWGAAQAEGAPARSLCRIFVWNANTGHELSSNILFSNRLSAASLSDDGLRIVIFGDQIAQICEVSPNKPLSPLLLAHPDIVSDALFNRAGTQVATRSGKRVWVWDCFNGKLCFTSLEHPVGVGDFAFSPDGTLLATCCWDQTADKYFAQVWNAKTGKAVTSQLWHSDGVLSVSFSSDGKRLATGGEDFAAMVWDARTGNTLTPPLWHEDKVRSAAFSPDGKWLVTVCANVVQIWDSDSGEHIVPRFRSLVFLSKAVFLPDGTNVAVFNTNGTAWKWRLPVDTRPLEDLSAVARLLAGGSDNALRAGPPSKPESLEPIWQRLASQYPTDFSVSSEQVAAWHEFQAAKCEQNEKWFAAAFHLNRLLLLRPADKALCRRLAQAQEHLKANDSRLTDR